MNEKIEIKFIESWSTEEIIKLYKAGGWWRESYNPSLIPALISGSFAFAIVRDISTGKTIGMGRILSDGISDAYIQDLVILPEYRGKNIGKKLVTFLIDHCVSKGIGWVGLIAEPGREEFYKDVGLKPMKDHVPMLYRLEK